MTNDRELQQNVLAALEWEAGLDAARIGVSVNDGVVTLQGTVRALREKWLAERAARHVRFVRAVANDIDVVVCDVLPTAPTRLSPTPRPTRSSGTARFPTARSKQPFGMAGSRSLGL
jgi:hypothetical protein